MYVYYCLSFIIVEKRMLLKIFKHCLRSYNLQLDIERDNINFPILYDTIMLTRKKLKTNIR